MGVPQWAQSGTQGSGETVAVSNRPEINLIQNSSSTTVAASGGAETIEVYAPTGSVYQAFGMHLEVGSTGGSTGADHLFDVTTQSKGGTQGRSDAQNAIKWNHGEWQTADTPIPSDPTAAYQAMDNLRATENGPIRILYKNLTDASQTKTRTMDLLFEEVSY